MIGFENFFGDISATSFLKDYWNKKPLVVKNALPQIKSFASKEDLLEFAFDEDFESRIIYEDKDEYKVKDGPLTNDDLKGNYTIACHALNLFSDEFKSIEDFITNCVSHWQFDDIMSTLSMKGASVGAHTDHYGVFIVQGQGKREWFIQENPNQDFKEDLEVKILKEFNPDYSVVLEPGDMIYIPPLCAHHGVTLEESISYSIGFKSLEDENIIKEFIFDMTENLASTGFFKSNFHPENKYELTEEIVDYFHSKITTELNDKDIFKSWLAHKLSGARYFNHPSQDDDVQDIAFDLKFTYYKVNELYHCYVNESFIELEEDDFKKLYSTIKKRDIQNAPQEIISFLKDASAAF